MPGDALYMFAEPGYGNASPFTKSSAGLLATAARGVKPALVRCSPHDFARM